MHRVVEQLRAAGLPPQDLQTAQFAVSPLYESRQPDPQTTKPAPDRRLPGVESGERARARHRPPRRHPRCPGRRRRQQHRRPELRILPIPSRCSARRAMPPSPMRWPRPNATPPPPASGSVRSCRSRRARRVPPRPMMRRRPCGRRADCARPDGAVGQRDDHVRARLDGPRHRPSSGCGAPADPQPGRALSAKAWRRRLRRSEFVQQRLAAGLVLALGDVALRSQVIEHVQLMLDRAGGRPCRRRWAT